MKILDDIIPEAGAFYVMDNGYLDRARLHTIHSGGAFSVIRAKNRLRLKLVTQTAADLGIPIYPAQLVPRMIRRLVTSVITVIARGTVDRTFERPINMGNRFRRVTVVAFVSRAASIIRLAHQPSPAIGIVRDIDVGLRRLGCCLSHRACAVQVRVYVVQLIEVMLIGSRAKCGGSIGARVREIIHATVLRAPVGRLVVESEGMGDFLAHHMPLFINIVISAGVEIGVVHLRRPLGDVNAAGNIDARQTQPTIIAVKCYCRLERFRRPSNNACSTRRPRSRLEEASMLPRKVGGCSNPTKRR